MHLPARLRHGRSLAPLAAIVAVIALPNLLTAGLHRAPIVTLLFGAENVHQFPVLQTTLSFVLVVVGIAIWWFGSRATVRRLIVGYAVVATVVLGAALFSLVANLQTFGPAQADVLLKDALIVWSMTVLDFSLWYWLIDSGWPESVESLIARLLPYCQRPKPDAKTQRNTHDRYA